MSYTSRARSTGSRCGRGAVDWDLLICRRRAAPGVKAKLWCFEGAKGLHFSPASLLKWQASHFRVSKMRMRREQRLLPFPSRGISGQWCRQMENYWATSSTVKVSRTSAQATTNSPNTLGLGCIGPEFRQKPLAHNEKSKK